MLNESRTKQWLSARSTAWHKAAQLMPVLQHRRHATLEEALDAVESYRSVARDLATARELAPRSRTTAGLESLYAQLHALISRRPRGGTAGLLDLLRADIPHAARELRSRIAGM